MASRGAPVEFSAAQSLPRQAMARCCTVGEMDEFWDADVETKVTPSGAFIAVLVLTPPAEIGPPVRWAVPGEYDNPSRAECAALDLFAEMTRRT